MPSPGHLPGTAGDFASMGGYLPDVNWLPAGALHGSASLFPHSQMLPRASSPYLQTAHAARTAGTTPRVLDATTPAHTPPHSASARANNHPRITSTQ
eukprot:360996-Chlamydomonas_euryale.AAC.1